MAAKKIKLILEDLRNVNTDPGHAFRVKKAINTTAYPIGNNVSLDDAQGIANDPNWTLEIIKKS
jgi:hypothetical protein